MNQQTGLTAGRDAFEGLRQTNEHGAEYWSARGLQPLLGYSQWRRFEQAIDRAKTSCEQSGNDPDHHFAGAGKVVELGSRSLRELSDYHLSRFACYLIAQNGDPRKPEIAQAQSYFAIQTRRALGLERAWGVGAEVEGAGGGVRLGAAFDSSDMAAVVAFSGELVLKEILKLHPCEDHFS